MSKDDHDRIDNFQRNVLLARAKIDKTPDLKKSKDLRPNISPLKTRAKKNSSETTPCGGKILTKKEDSKLSSGERCNTKAPRHTSPPEKEISPSSKAPDQKKRKRSNAVVMETSYDVQHDQCIKSEQYTHTNPETEKIGYNHHEVSPDYSKNIRNTPDSSEKSPAKTKQPEDSIIQELQQISAQLNSESDSCTLSPMQSRMTYGESRYQKPAQALMKASDTNCVETNSDNPRVHNFIGPQLSSHNYPVGLGPPGIELPSTAPPPHGTPDTEIFYREQPRSGSTRGYTVPQPISHRYPPGFDPSEMTPPTGALPFHDHSTATANNQYSRTSDYSTQRNSQSLAREERIEPSCPRDEQWPQNLKYQGSNYHRSPHSNSAAVSGYLKYFEPEPSLMEPKPDSFTDEKNDRSSFVVSEKLGKVTSRNFIGKHPSMMKKVYRRDFNKENIALPLETDSDGEVQAILSGHSPHKDSSMSDSFKTSNESHSNMKKPAVIPTFTQLNNSADHQVIGILYSFVIRS